MYNEHKCYVICEDADRSGQMNDIKWAEINLDHLIHNISEIRKIVGEDTKIAAVVKANGYGHGALQVTETLLENGADFIAVSSINEAVEIRKRFKRAYTLVLGYTIGEKIENAIRNGVIMTIFSYDQALECSKVAESIGIGVSIHIKIDTGMNRLGFLPNQKSVDEIIKISKLPNIKVNGIFSHFACADDEDKSFSHNQYKKYDTMVKEIEKQGLNIPMRHIANSAATLDLPEYHLDMVRPGICLYGLYPSKTSGKNVVSLKPVMSLKTRISNIKVIEEAGGVSYGQNHLVKKGDKIATIPIGYADGYTRLLSNKGQVLIKGNRYNIIGNICMDQCMVDITGSTDILVGDEVTIFGEDSGKSIPVEEIAEQMGTINYEVVCMVGRRVPRVYKKDGKIIKKVNYLE